jgi:hypothetical protein
VTAPQPVAWYKWVLCIILAGFWALPAIVALPHMQLSSSSLTLAEIFWSAICLALLAKGLSWFRIELSDRGVTQRGLFHTLYIAWPDASVKRVGLLIFVSSAKGSVRINPFIYRNPKDLDEFLSFCSR